MKLAEALSLRADLQKRVSLLKLRMKNSAKVQEGDKPAEKMEELFNKLEGMLAQLEGLIYRINDTNMHTLCEGESLTRMMARKDVLSIRVALMRELLKHVTENDTRFGKNELKYIRQVNVSELQKETDGYARQLRELNVKIQGLNWNTDLR